MHSQFHSLYCGHLLIACPVRPLRPAVSTVDLPFSISTIKHIPVLLSYFQRSLSAKALIDSGSIGNLISLTTLQRLQARQKSINQYLYVQSILRKLFGRCNVR